MTTKRTRFARTLARRSIAVVVVQSLICQAMLLGPRSAWGQSCPVQPTTTEQSEGFDLDSAPSSQSVPDSSDDASDFLWTGWDSGGSDGGDQGDGASARVNVSGIDGTGADEPSGGLPTSMPEATEASNSGSLSGGFAYIENLLSVPETAGDPIDVQRADKLHTQVDYVSGGAGALRLARIYHSNASVNTAQVTVPVGVGWHHYYDRTLQVVSATQVRLHRANGRTLEFNGSGNSWSSNLPAGVLTAIAGGWQYVNHRDIVETYDASGRLVSISSGGVSTSLEYSGNRLVSVANSFGRRISFAYDAAGRLGVSTLPGGGTLTYSYDALGNLVGVRFADGSVRQYMYENASFPNVLTGVIDESGRRRLTWGYDSSGRPNHGHYGTASNGVNISYSGSTATTTDARGTQRTRTFSAVAGRAVLAAHQTAATSDSTATSWTFGYDGPATLRRLHRAAVRSDSSP